MAWYQLIATGDPTDANDYNAVGGPSCIGATNFICAIQASPDSSNKPILTTNLRNEMINALNNRASTTNVQLRASR